VLPVRYEHHLHIKSEAISLTLWRRVSCEVQNHLRGLQSASELYRLSDRHKHHLNKQWNRTGVFPVGYEHNLHIKM
jgi:hypothetical protein